MEIQEAYVSYKTSKLLKNKGFDEPCHHYYSNRLLKFDPSLAGKNSYQSEDVYSAPTIQLAMRWLRERYGIVIEIYHTPERPLNEGWFYSVQVYKVNKTSLELFHSYEDACEDAIKYCLKNLI